MSSLASTLADSELANRVFNERQLGEAITGSPARRYALVNRALKDGSLIRLKRGTYLLDRPHRSEVIHPFAVAQALLPNSYISFETALASHGWIPEAVYTTASVTPGRKTLEFDTSVMGQFTFHPLAIRPYQFLVGVERQQQATLTAFVARPLRALLDLVALRKQSWIGLDWLTNGLRIDEEHLRSLGRKDFARLKPVYKHKGVNGFLEALELAVRADRGGSASTSDD